MSIYTIASGPAGLYPAAPVNQPVPPPYPPPSLLQSTWFDCTVGALACTALAGAGLMLYASACKRERREAVQQEELRRYLAAHLIEPPTTYNAETVAPQAEQVEGPATPSQSASGPNRERRNAARPVGGGESDSGSEASMDDLSDQFSEGSVSEHAEHMPPPHE